MKMTEHTSPNIPLPVKSHFIKVPSYVFLTVGALIMIVPFLWMLSTSLKDQQQLFAWPPNWLPHPFVWSNYTEVMTKINFGLYGLNTFKITRLSPSAA